MRMCAFVHVFVVFVVHAAGRLYAIYTFNAHNVTAYPPSQLPPATLANSNLIGGSCASLRAILASGRYNTDDRDSLSKFGARVPALHGALRRSMAPPCAGYCEPGY